MKIVPYAKLDYAEKWFADLADSIKEQKSDLEKKVLQKQKRKGHKTGISVILFPTDAKKVLNNFSFSTVYLKEIIHQYIPENTRKRIDEMSSKELRHYGYVIRGVAQKELAKQ